MVRSSGACGLLAFGRVPLVPPWGKGGGRGGGEGEEEAHQCVPREPSWGLGDCGPHNTNRSPASGKDLV